MLILLGLRYKLVFLSKENEHLTLVALKSLDCPAAPSSSHGLLPQRRQQH